MKPLEEFFTEQRIVRLLCRKRLEAARKRRQNEFLSGVTGHNLRQKAIDQLFEIMPPRRLWAKFRPRLEVRKVNAPSAYLSALTRFTLAELARQVPGAKWVEELKKFIASVQVRALNWSSTNSFRYQRAAAIPKSRPGNNQEYRALSIFGLEDTILCSGFSAYLQHAIDPALIAGSIAFRAPPAGGPPPTHNDAVRRILNFRAKFLDHQALWCGECDIEAFFDTVDHAVVQSKVDDIAAELRVKFDRRLLDFLDSFLFGYNYQSLCSEASSSLRKEGIVNPRFKDVSAILKERKIESLGPVGIPQGSFLSCILANIILSQADRSCVDTLGRHGFDDGLYLRYCDDIILLHRSRAACSETLDSYLATLAKLKLPFHKPVKVENYGRVFWKAKSKLPFSWRTGAADGAAPWISFVGYQIHRDGRIRVRDKSVQRQLERQRAIADKIVGFLKTLRRLRSQSKTTNLPSERSLRTRILYHFLSFSVGIPRAFRLVAPRGKVCWAAGFPLTQEFECSWDNSRILDRERRRSLKRLAVAYKKYLPRPEKSQNSGREPRQGDKWEWNLRYDGPEFSYTYAIRGISGPKLRAPKKEE